MNEDEKLEETIAQFKQYMLDAGMVENPKTMTDFYRRGLYNLGVNNIKEEGKEES